ncbi:hypothetical protein [Herminiimonas fonticola]|uniref:Uncharacterized protein n=1 Tax=Herminiimonas fonticola TaxID=303380 RepID=A0A4R6GFJ3_9BURK|nr:hypothetical protein [Herminiimonas fonticola]RBA24509.1 hypothetical protein Hfont_0142 [Herminiimonas fonticola]TDN93626.1 hypothetical protein EV677_0156 [Herminiimonas fonticola]
MSTRRKFVIALNVIAVCIASLSYAVHRYVQMQTPAAPPAIEMQLLPIQNLTAAQHSTCGLSCVITSRSALGITH